MYLFEIKKLGVKSPEKEILKAISFTVEPGSHLTITGPSGSGKSTILKVLATLQSYDSGDVFYKGKDLATLNPIPYRQEVSYCFQQPVLFGETVRDNLSFPFEIRNLLFDEEKARKMLQDVHLDSSFLDHPITKLSGGEKQRIALIRNLMFEPKVILLDEVTAGLDVETKEIVRALIERIHVAGTTIIEVTHDNDELAHATHLLEIVEGELTHE